MIALLDVRCEFALHVMLWLNYTWLYLVVKVLFTFDCQSEHCMEWRRGGRGEDNIIDRCDQHSCQEYRSCME